MHRLYWTEPLQLADENLKTVLSVPIFFERHCWLPALSLPWSGQMRGAASVYGDPSWIIHRGATSVIKGQIFESYAPLSFRFIPFQCVVYLFNITNIHPSICGATAILVPGLPPKAPPFLSIPSSTLPSPYSRTYNVPFWITFFYLFPWVFHWYYVVEFPIKIFLGLFHRLFLWRDPPILVF